MGLKYKLSDEEQATKQFRHSIVSRQSGSEHLEERQASLTLEAGQVDDLERVEVWMLAVRLLC